MIILLIPIVNLFSWFIWTFGQIKLGAISTQSKYFKFTVLTLVIMFLVTTLLQTLYRWIFPAGSLYSLFGYVYLIGLVMGGICCISLKLQIKESEKQNGGK